MNWQDATLLFVTLIISLTVHEAAHALVAYWGGDRTAYRGGQVTLNPLPHIQREPFGMLILPIVALLLSGGRSTFGFAHAPYDPIWAHHHPKRAALMAAAGPFANVLLATLAFAILWFLGRPASGEGEAVRQIAGQFLYLNLLLAVFNILPLPPLDGAAVLGGLSRTARNLFDGLQRIPYMGLVVFVLLIRYVDDLFWPVFRTVNGWLPVPFGR
ncbi:MAG: site-2 protease family protein [Planctomycetes bacterium]|nr:site-2 protease family protein [Planctomycetota bacterium]